MAKLKKINRLFNRCWTIYYRKLKEKHHSNGTKYLFFRANNRDSRCLVVSFAAFAPKGSRYNYVRTLKDLPCHKLFLLDIGGGNSRGTYLIDKDSHDKAHEIIEDIIEKYNIENLFFIGSSKGGYCALDFAFVFPNVTCIIAAPQYFIASYLNKASTLPNLEAIVGKELNDENLDEIDNRLRNIIKSSSIRPRKVYLHYSDKEHTYENHVKDMIEDLKKVGIDVEENVEHYLKHEDLIYYYPNYLKKIIKKYIV